MADEQETVTVRAADLKAFLEAVDMDYVNTDNYIDLQDRVERLDRAVNPQDYEEDPADE